MSKVLINETTLTGIADAIREKEGSTEKIPTVEMADRVRALGGGGYSEKNTVIFTGEIQGAVDSSGYRVGVKVAHGLSQKPKYAIMTSDAKTDGTVKGTVTAGVFTEGLDGFSTSDNGAAKYGFVLTTNTNTGATGGTAVRYQYPLNDATAVWSWDEESWCCTKPVGSQNFGAEIKYEITFYA